MKLLNGQCEIDFEAWLIVYFYKHRPDYNKYPNSILLKKFYRRTLSSQWGVIQDFFGEKQILFGKEFEDDFWLFTECPIYINPKKDNYVSIEKIESRKEVLIKANEIYNKRYEKS